MSVRRTPLPFDAALASDAAFESMLASIKIPVAYEASEAAPAGPVVSHNPFFDSLRTPELQVHGPTLNPTAATANLTLTDNFGVTLASTESPPLDLFAELGSVDAAALPALLAASWAADPLATLRIIWNARSIPRGKGKKDAWVRGAAWLADRHPQTLLRNLAVLVQPTDRIPQKRKAAAIDADDGDGNGDGDRCDVVDEEPEITPRSARSHGYYKDLLNILVLSSLPSDATPSATQFSVGGDFTRVPGLFVDRESPYAALRSKASKSKVDKAAVSAEHAGDATRIAQVLSAEGGFHRALHLTVARLFGQQLRDDLAALDAATACRTAKQDDEARAFESHISLAAKWAPTEGAFHDKHTRIASSIAEFLTPFDGPARTAAGVVRALAIYRTKYLAPLRKHLELVERKMSAGDCTSIKYSRVPSLAMSKLTKHFYKHDAAGFTAYLQRVAEGKATISGAVMTPAVLFRQAQVGGVEAVVAEAQWKTLVDSIRDEGKLSRCIAVADVSGSMMSPTLPDDRTTPMDSSMALSILVAQVTEPPFANAIISFTDWPQFIDLTGTTLAEHADQIRREGSGYNTDFIAVFRQILERATAAKLTQEQMIDRLFVFSDMEFDQCHWMGNEYATHYEVVQQAYAAAGYAMPELVFWNLAAGQSRTSKPVKSHQPGTALVSGYSAAIVKVFLAGADFGEPENEDAFEEIEDVNEETGEVVVKKQKAEMTPDGVMRSAIGHASFAGLKVYD